MSVTTYSLTVLHVTDECQCSLPECMHDGEPAVCICHKVQSCDPAIPLGSRANISRALLELTLVSTLSNLPSGVDASTAQQCRNVMYWIIVRKLDYTQFP